MKSDFAKWLNFRFHFPVPFVACDDPSNWDIRRRELEKAVRLTRKGARKRPRLAPAAAALT